VTAQHARDLAPDEGGAVDHEHAQAVARVALGARDGNQLERSWISTRSALWEAGRSEPHDRDRQVSGDRSKDNHGGHHQCFAI
jgi:hypothetical protein